jgi:polyhydroxyalkanoate synthesis regulator phasin
MATKKLDIIIRSLSNTSGSFKEYANRVKKIIDELENCKKLTQQNEALTRETKDCPSKISTLEKENVKLNDKINEIVEKNTKTLNTIELTNKSEYELLKRKYDALNKEIDKLHNARSIEMTDVTHNDILKNINKCRTMSTEDKNEMLTLADEFIGLANSRNISDKGMKQDLLDIGNKIKEKCYDTSTKPTIKLGGKSRKQRKSRKSKMTRRVHK